eukprot:350628-Chlamydomonas_euryale.AAC.11
MRRRARHGHGKALASGSPKPEHKCTSVAHHSTTNNQLPPLCPPPSNPAPPSFRHPPSDTERRTLFVRMSSHTPAARFVLSGWELLARITPDVAYVPVWYAKHA